MSRIIIFVSVLLFSLPAHAELDLKPVHPDESVEYTYNQRFAVQNALDRMAQIAGALESFRKLTEAAEGKVSKQTLADIGNTGWEIQNLGFMNWPGAIEGTLRKQAYLIRKLTYELVKEKVEAGKMSPADLNGAEKDLKAAEKAFQEFWDSFGVGD